MGGHEQAVEDPEVRAALRKRAKGIVTRALIVALAGTAIAFVLP